MQKIEIENKQVRISTNADNVTNTTIVSFDDGLGRALVEAGWQQPTQCQFPACEKHATRFGGCCDDGYCASHYKKANEFTGNHHQLRRYKAK